MGSAVDGQAIAPNRLDLPLNLATMAPAQAAHDYVGGQRRSMTGEAQLETVKINDAGEIVSTPRDTRSDVWSSPTDQPEAPKPRRVRTGCLTCRERHLKCDEGNPSCQNCQKADRACRKGVRLNFIDTQVAAPPYSFRLTRDSNIDFCDESRDIASEYVGGYDHYPPKNENISGSTTRSTTSFLYNVNAAVPSPMDLQIGTSFLDQTQESPSSQNSRVNSQDDTPASTLSSHTLQYSSLGSSEWTVTSPDAARPYLNTADEVLLMQVFVEEVGLWMDSMDSMKHFSHILTFNALSKPMLLHAFMACGARHLFLVNPSFGEEKALYYYNMSTRDLLNCLQSSDRDSILCATTAVVLNVYEVMCERAMHRMNHIASARALIKECRWDAKSTGVGGACFWLNVGLETLSCLRFNWKLAWDPDTWGVDMNMAAYMGSIAGNEEVWTHRMVYICAKIADFQFAVHQFRNLDPISQQGKLACLCEEWRNLKAWCDEWTRCVPRSMQPLGYLLPWQKNSKSSFPEVWLIKRSATVGRLLYHTACCLLARLHPIESDCSEEMLRMQQSHAHDICGIIAHVKDRGVASVSLRCLAIAGECLVDRAAQEEVIDILGRTMKETGWQIEFLQRELIRKWGWNNTATEVSPPEQNRHPPIITTPSADLGSSLLNSAEPSSQTCPPAPQGVANPFMASADFSFDQDPHQNYYASPQNSQPPL